MSTAVNVRTLGVLPWQVAVDTPFRMLRMLESTLGIGTLPRQTGVYVPRRLSHIGGPVTGTLGRRVRRDRPASLAWLVSCRPGALLKHPGRIRED